MNGHIKITEHILLKWKAVNQRQFVVQFPVVSSIRKEVTVTEHYMNIYHKNILNCSSCNLVVIQSLYRMHAYLKLKLLDHLHLDSALGSTSVIQSVLITNVPETHNSFKVILHRKSVL